MRQILAARRTLELDRDSPEPAASQPLSEDDPESIYQACATTDARRAIRAAGTEQMRTILKNIAEHLWQRYPSEVTPA